MLLALLVSLLPAATSTSSTATSSPGTSLARELGAEQDIECEEVIERLLELDRSEWPAFVESWPRVAHGRSAMAIYAAAKAEIERKRPAARACSRVERTQRFMPVEQRNNTALLFEASQRSAAGAWALSFFFGFGTGNFYAGAPGWGVTTLLGEVLGAALAVGGLSSDDGTMAGVGLLLNRLAWFADWGGAIANAASYNEGLRAQLSASRLPSVPGVSFAFEF